MTHFRLRTSEVCALDAGMSGVGCVLNVLSVQWEKNFGGHLTLEVDESTKVF